MQWKVTQTGPDHAAALSEMQSKISQPELRVIKETNKLVSDVKLNDTHLTIHPFFQQLKWNDLAVVVDTDAAQKYRVDGSSSGGYVVTVAPSKQFIEGHMTDMSLIGWSTNKLKCVAKLSAEARLLWSETHGCQVTMQNVTDAVKATPGNIVLNAKRVFDALQNSSSTETGPAHDVHVVKETSATHQMAYRQLDDRSTTVS